MGPIDLRKGPATKLDDFLGIFNPKIYVADFGNFKQGFLIMKLIQNINFRVQGILFSTIVLRKIKQDTLSGRHFWISILSGHHTSSHICNHIQKKLIMTFLIFSQISFQTTTKTSHFSLNLFSTRITCFGAQALVTCCCILYKTKGARPNFTFTITFTSESESKIHTNRSLQRFSFGKNWPPPE